MFYIFFFFCFSILFFITSKTAQKRRYLKRQEEEEWKKKKTKFIKCVLHIKIEFCVDVDTLCSKMMSMSGWIDGLFAIW